MPIICKRLSNMIYSTKTKITSTELANCLILNFIVVILVGITNPFVLHKENSSQTIFVRRKDKESL